MASMRGILSHGQALTIFPVTDFREGNVGDERLGAISSI